MQDAVLLHWKYAHTFLSGGSGTMVQPTPQLQQIHVRCLADWLFLRYSSIRSTASLSRSRLVSFPSLIHTLGNSPLARSVSPFRRFVSFQSFNMMWARLQHRMQL
jgi:hypothetical protein